MTETVGPAIKFELGLSHTAGMPLVMELLLGRLLCDWLNPVLTGAPYAMAQGEEKILWWPCELASGQGLIHRVNGHCFELTNVAGELELRLPLNIGLMCQPWLRRACHEGSFAYSLALQQMSCKLRRLKPRAPLQLKLLQPYTLYVQYL